MEAPQQSVRVLNKTGDRMNMKARVPEHIVVLEMDEVCRMIAKKNRVSSAALLRATKLIRDGIIELMATGYAIRWRKLLLMFPKEMPARKRWHYLKSEYYTTKPSTVIHIVKADGLTTRIRRVSAAIAEGASEEHIMSLINPSLASAYIAFKKDKQYTKARLEIRKHM